MNTITKEKLTEFVDSVYKVSTAEFAQEGEVRSVLFMKMSDGEILAANVDNLLENQEGKETLGLLPSYLAFMQGSFTFSAMLNEAWLTKTPSANMSEDEMRNHTRELLKKYGSISQLPEDMRQEILCLHIESFIGDYTIIWEVKRDSEGNPTLQSRDENELPPPNEKAQGRLAQGAALYKQISEIYTKNKEVFNGSTPSADETERRTAFAEMVAHHNGPEHARAFTIAQDILSNFNDKKNNPRIMH